MNNKIILFTGLALILGLAGGLGMSKVGTEEILEKSMPTTQERLGNGVGRGIGSGDNNQMGNRGTPDRGNCLADDCLLVEDLEYPVGKLPQEVQDALVSAIEDEYKAYSTYEAVIEKFGSTRPFSMIIGAEEQHISSLKALFTKYGLDIPENTWSSKVEAPTTLQEACQTGVDAEIANAALYNDNLLPTVRDYEDITGVFTSLMRASQEKHLVAFERCN